MVQYSIVSHHIDSCTGCGYNQFVVVIAVVVGVSVVCV